MKALGLRFALAYLSIAGAFFTLYAFPFELFGAREDWLHGYLQFYAKLSGGMLSLFDRSVSVSDTYIHGRYPLQIVRNCDAAEINILFASALLAFPAPLLRRLAALGVGLCCLVLLNVTRICCLYFIGVHAPGSFKVMHEEVWPLLLVAATVALFIAATRRLDGRASTKLVEPAVASSGA